MTYRSGLPRSPTSSACVRTAFLLPHDHTLRSQWLHSHAQLCCVRLWPLGRLSSRRMSACRRSSLSTLPLRSRSCPHCLVSSHATSFPMERCVKMYSRTIANLIRALQSLFREPVCDFRVFPIPILRTLFNAIANKPARNNCRHMALVIRTAKSLLFIRHATSL